MPLLLRGISKEGADAGKFARGGRGAEPLPAPVGEKGPKIGGFQIEEAGRRNLLAAISAKEVDEPMRGRHISAHGVRRAATVVLEMIAPLRRERGCGVNYACGCVSHLRIITASVRPRNISSSDP